MSQSDLAEKIRVSLKTIQNYEKGKVTVPERSIADIANVFGISRETLLTYSEAQSLEFLNQINSNTGGTNFNFNKTGNVEVVNTNESDFESVIKEKDKRISDLREEVERLRKHIDILMKNLDR